MRPPTDKFKGLKEGDTITFHWCSGEGLLVKVMCDPKIYTSAEEAFEACGVETILPGKSRREAIVPCATYFQLE